LRPSKGQKPLPKGGLFGALLIERQRLPAHRAPGHRLLSPTLRR
jgi:hypothetical protein